MTPSGTRAVEDITVSDLVPTKDNRPRRALRPGDKAVNVADYSDLDPMLLPSNYLGHNCTSRDLWVSRNHRTLIPAGLAEILFEEEKLLIPAKYLIGHSGIAAVEDVAEVVYGHRTLHLNETVISNGLACETLTLFLALAGGSEGYGETAHLCLRQFKAELTLDILS